MKVVKGNTPHRFITGDDIVVIKDSEEKGEIVTVDNVLDEYKKEIDKLKSNVKYIYSYGGVGGNGRGGSGGGSTTPASLYISLNGIQIQSGQDNVIVLPKRGQYELFMNVSNSGGETFYVDYSYGENVDNVIQTVALSTDRNKCKKSINLDLDSNGKIKIVFYNEESILGSIDQDYIVDPHTFDTKLMYVFNNGTFTKETEFIKQSDGRYEYFIGNSIYQTPFVAASFTIGLPNVTNITLTYQIGDTDGEDNNISYETISENPIHAGKGKVFYGSKTDTTYDQLKIYLGNLQRNGEPFTSGNNMGTYTVSITLSYSVNNRETTLTKTYDMTLIPSDLYINVRNPEGLIYDTEEDLVNDLNNIEEGQELEKAVSIGAYSSYYCKVFEGPMRSGEEHYDITFKAYNYDNGSYTLYKQYTVDGVTEQREMAKPFSISFDTEGIKKLEFLTEHKKDGSTDNPTIKYIYVKKPSGKQIDWYPDITQQVFYFRANTAEPYSEHFPYIEQFGSNPIELSENSSPITLQDYNWTHHEMNLYDATILSFGMQYSSVNVDGVKIFDTYDYGKTTPNMTMYSTALFEKPDPNNSDNTNKKIFIPTESKFDKTVSSQYHLVQIVRNRLGYDGNNNPQYATYLYIDGVLESNDPSITTYKYDIDRIVLNNVNVVYNMISIQYLNIGENNSIDGLVYQSWLAYKERMHVGPVTDAERVIYNNLKQLQFDGADLVVPESFVKTSAKVLEIPTMMVVYTGREETYNTFTESLFKGYRAGDNESFTPTVVDMWWSPGLAELENIPVPANGVYDDETDFNYHGSWQIDLQGTSTMRNKIKNFSLSIVTDSDERKILMSPNYDPNDTNTFLPENTWTLKADIADSAHANNTAVGKFVNRNCTKFSDSNGIEGSYKNYIKNTLEGFPFLMYFQIGPKIYYLGVYNFNMGRQSQYNLGYHSETNMANMLKNLNETNATINRNSVFKFSVGGTELINNLAVGEVRENYSEFDFHQYDRSVLFQNEDSTVSKMFGKRKDMTFANYDRATTTLENFVYSVAMAGAFCFAKIGKEPVLSNNRGFNPETGKPYEDGNCVTVYNKVDNPDGTHTEQVPDVQWQFYYDANDRKVWRQEPGSITFNNVSGNLNNLLQCISDKNYDGVSQQDYGHLDFTSASEYYTVCMAFGLVDSILKNLTIRSWDGKKCYIAFYDMDCAFGENNAGEEKISSLASTDYWYSENNNGFIKSADVIYDYWNKSIGYGFDYTSSYLFAIVKYAQAILNVHNRTLNNQIIMTNYPQEFWAKLRHPDTGELKNANYFVNNYFSSGIGKIPAILASLNYQVKYLYYGTIYDEETGAVVGDSYLANEHAFNGSRIHKVRDWLNRRLHLLDVVFNLQGISMPIGGGYLIPTLERGMLSPLSANPDILIMSDMFTLEGNPTVLIESKSRPVSVWAPTNTPFVINRGGSSEIYLLCAGTGNPNTVEINVNPAEPLRFLGSKEFTDLSAVEPFLSSSKIIYSDRIEHIRCGISDTFPPTAGGLKIRSKSIKTISLPITTFSGPLNIDNTDLYGQSLESIDIHNSGFYGEWERFNSLKELNISSVNNSNATIKVSQCPLLTGEKCFISGTENNLTTIQELNLSGVSGKFLLEYTNIETIDFSSAVDKISDFEIRGDKKLNKLSLSGFRSIKISDCPNLESITISNPDKCQEFILDIPYDYINADGSIPKGILKFNDVTIAQGKTGTFDFTKFTNLNNFTLTGCKNVDVIKMPNRKVSIGTLKNNLYLEFVDTAGHDSIIELTTDSTFYNCPRYNMKQSWWSDDNQNGVDIRTLTDIKDGNRTKMCISVGCTTLAHTFDKVNSGINSKYIKTSADYFENSWGQKVKNYEMNQSDAEYFINLCVGSSNNRRHDNEYIEETIVHNDETDTDETVYMVYDKPGQGDGLSVPDNRANIVSLNGCFYKQRGIIYQGKGVTFPNLSGYTSLVNVSQMYYDTGVKHLSSRVLSFPEELNTNENSEINWYNIIGTGDISISKDAFKNISYRIADLSSLILTIYNTEADRGNRGLLDSDILNTTDENDYLDIVEILYPRLADGEEDTFTWNGEEYVQFTRLTQFNVFSVNPRQYVDYTKLFDACPNVRILSGFLNSDLSRSKIDGMLKHCTVLDIIRSSFNHTGSMETSPKIDLYDFFNWGDNHLYGMHELFTSNENDPGFCIKKTISQECFAEILGTLHNYTNLSVLSNLFSYCTINDYTGLEIKLSYQMDKVTNINSLFYNCSAIRNSNQVPLKIRRSLFKNLPNITMMANTFYGVWFDHMLSYDFFCKRIEKPDTVTVKINGQYVDGATLITTGYSASQINSMANCFTNAKFINCDSWFDYNDNTYENPDDSNKALRPVKDIVTYNGDSSFTEYYRKVSGSYVKYDISEPVAYLDTLNNFTNYVKDTYTIVSGGDAQQNGWKINNHPIEKDLQLFGNTINGYPYDKTILEKFNITPTYCCLPPDIFHGCSYKCDLTNVFARTNIIGVIPQHLLIKCTESSLTNMFQNVNILPNLIYHYDKNITNYTNEDPDYELKYQKHQDYISLISAKDSNNEYLIPIDNYTATIQNSTDNSVYEFVGSSDDDAIVLFRNSNGELRRRKVIVGKDYSKSQFVYVPQGYTSNENLSSAFTFRYNLPQQVDLTQGILRNEGITWIPGPYGIECSPDDRPELWPYHTQYFFFVSESISWVDLRSMSSPFISDEQDISFEKSWMTGIYEPRVFSTTTDDYQNVWFAKTGTFTNSTWHNYFQQISTFNVFLNLCGDRNIRTGMIKDYGCPINNARNYPNVPRVDSLVAGILSIFLNGKVLSQSVDAGRLTSSNGSSIIGYDYGFGRNIIMPNISTKLVNHPRIVLSYKSSNLLFYQFMFPVNSLQNYKDIFNIPSGNGISQPGIDTNSTRFVVYD